jgi:hypothetical protein
MFLLTSPARSVSGFSLKSTAATSGLGEQLREFPQTRKKKPHDLIIFNGQLQYQIAYWWWC